MSQQISKLLIWLTVFLTMISMRMTKKMLPDDTNSYLPIEEVIKVLTMSKKSFIDFHSRVGSYPVGMCSFIIESIRCVIGCNSSCTCLTSFIPKFTSEFLLQTSKDPCSLWWNIYNMQARLDAFDKLINYYTELRYVGENK